MTKLYLAEPAKEPNPDLAPEPTGRLYSVDSETEAALLKKPTERGVKYEIPRENRYSTGVGSDFDVELNVYDAEKALPIRGMSVDCGTQRGITDRTGRAVLTLKRGLHNIIVSGNGFVETGDFAPTPVKFDKMIINAEVDENAIFTVYSSGQIVRGERRQFNQPNPHHGQPMKKPETAVFIRENWVALELAGLDLAGVAYYIGKSNNKAP
jgi:hypothetical protein